MEFKITVVGATSTTGHEIIRMLAEVDWSIDHVWAVSADQSSGLKISFGDQKILTTIAVDAFDFNGVDLVFFATDDKVSSQAVPRALASGCKVIDNSTAFASDATVPLIVPEVNGQQLLHQMKKLLVTVPDAMTTALTLALHPLHHQVGIKRVVLSTYQAVSNKGQSAMNELHHQTRALFVNQDIETQVLPRQIAFNIIPHINVMNAQGFTVTEMRIVRELQRFIAPELAVAVTCVQVPVFVGDCVAVAVELVQPLKVSEARHLFASSLSVSVIDRPQEAVYVTPLDIVGTDQVFISRIRQDFSVPNGLLFWLACDNLRKGTALNNIQIAQQWLGC